ncbi:hypothetical protein PCANC_00971 [Puccinia coronata f. sp. avenae]|uniref:Uncharacterized protein n=1 Tax=Puccinia coronata f. sp. avenae TaxID=200324 RepID=A0A2N5W6K0_9BASI|nr:hypothetical protein PCANC_03993 [Puccinia coronata f. sp. avenae]PLW57867.1 hypothetical protein PCANC_00971 [Puccinia coronata f. sp. avenae]
MPQRGVASLQPSFRRLCPAPHIPSGHLTTARPRGRAGNSGSSPDAPVLARGFDLPAGPLLNWWGAPPRLSDTFASANAEATDVTSVAQTDFMSAGPTDTLEQRHNVSVGAADVTSVW